MANYDFQSLSPIEFEELTRDLLQLKWNVHLESFRNGRDKGIDFRYACLKANIKIIVQCKRYESKAFSRLLNDLKAIEYPKIQRLGPTRYVLATSSELSPDNKNKIFSALSPYIKDPSDILGREDINNLLGQFPQVETNHFKLWLTSVPVVQRIQNSGIFNFSDNSAHEIRKKLSRYVVGKGHERLMKIGTRTINC